MIPGFFQTNFFPEKYLQEDFWLDAGLDTSKIHIFSDIMTAPIFLSDNGDNVFVQGGLEVRDTSYFNDVLINTNLTINGDISLTSNTNKLYFGENQEASIYFDGSDLNIDVGVNPSNAPIIKLNDDVEISGGLTVPTVTTTQIFDSSDRLKIDVNNEALIDRSADLSIDWEDRTLYALGGSDAILNWRTAGLADFGNSDIVTTGKATIGDVTGTAGLLRVKSDASHNAIHIEENSGIESWQIGVQADGDLLFRDSVGDVKVTFQDGGNVGIGLTDPARKFEIASTDGFDRISIYHDNANAHFRTDAGQFRFITDEGTNTDSVLNIIGKGTGNAVLTMNSETVLRRAATVIESIPGASIPWRLFNNSTKGETQRFRIAGFKDGDEKRTADLRISSIEDDTFRITGVSNYRFDGHVKTTDLTVDGSVVMMSNLPGADPSNAGQLWVDSSSGDVIKVSQG